MPLKIIVAVKRVVDHNIQVLVKQDGSGVELEHVKMAMNPFDENALEAAVKLKEAGIASEVIAISIGNNDCIETLRSALAIGATSAVLIKTEKTLEPLNIAKILAHIAKDEKPDIIFLGKQAIDDDCNQTGQMLSSLLNWPQATNISDIELTPDNLNIITLREIDEGQQKLQLSLPCILTADLRLNEPRFVSLLNIMKAKKLPVTEINLDDLGLELKQHFTTLKVSQPKGRKAGQIVANLDELLNILNEKKLLNKKEV